MGFITDIVTPAQLTGFVREEATGGLPFGAVFPPRAVDDIVYEIEQADLSGIHEVARFRTWDTAMRIGKRPGIEIIGGELPPLGWGYLLSEEDMARIAKLRQGVAERSDQRVVDTLFNDARRAAWAVQNRLTLAHGQLLETGQVLLEELGNVESGNAVKATFDVPAAHLNVTPATLWSDRANAEPADDLVAWETTYADNNSDLPPDEWWISKTVMTDLRLNESLRNASPFNAAVGIPARLDETGVAQVLAEYGVQGRIRVVDVRRPPLGGGARASVLDARAVIGVKFGMGETLYGVPPIISVMGGDARIELTDAPGIVAYSVDTIGPPPKIRTFAEAVALPILTDPNGLFSASV